MNNLQRGFVAPLLILAIVAGLIVIGGWIYLTMSQANSTPAISPAPSIGPIGESHDSVWQKITYAGLIFGYPPSWDEQPSSSGKGNSVVFTAPPDRSTLLFVTRIQASADSQSNSEFVGGSIAFAEKYNQGFGLMKAPDVYLKNLDVYAKVWESKDFYNQVGPTLEYLVPIKDDIVVLYFSFNIPSEHQNIANFKISQDFIDRFLAAITMEVRI